MKLSKEKKEELIAELFMPWGAVDLMCDGCLISLRVQLVKAMTYRVKTYVNGVIKGSWMNGSKPSPEQRFLRKSVRPNVSPSRRTKLEKALGKRYVSKDPYYSGTFTMYLPDWSSGKAAINHLLKVCESIEVATPEQVSAFTKTGAEAPLEANAAPAE